MDTVCEFLARYVRRLHSDRYLKKILSDTPGLTFLDIICPSDISYVISLIMNSKYVWLQQLKGNTKNQGPDSEKVKPQFTSGEGRKRIFGDTLWNKSGRDFFKDGIENWKPAYDPDTEDYHVLCTAWEEWLTTKSDKVALGNWTRKSIRSVLETRRVYPDNGGSLVINKKRTENDEDSEEEEDEEIEYESDGEGIHPYYNCRLRLSGEDSHNGGELESKNNNEYDDDTGIADDIGKQYESDGANGYDEMGNGMDVGDIVDENSISDSERSMRGPWKDIANTNMTQIVRPVVVQGKSTMNVTPDMGKLVVQRRAKGGLMRTMRPVTRQQQNGGKEIREIINGRKRKATTISEALEDRV